MGSRSNRHGLGEEELVRDSWCRSRGKRGGGADVVGFDEPGDPAFEAEGEPAMLRRWTASPG